MPDIFGVDIAGTIGDAFSEFVFDVTLTITTPTTRTPGSEDDGTNPTDTDHIAKGFVSEYNEKQIDGTIIRLGDQKVVLFGSTLPSGVVPSPGDKTTAEGVPREIVHVKRDPASATYVCQVR